MNTRSSLILGVAIVLGCLIVTLFSNSATVGQGNAAGKEGRYQVAVGGPQATIVVTDTTTGQTWVNLGVDNWRSMGKAPK
jgi:hypothetical protein